MSIEISKFFLPREMLGIYLGDRTVTAASVTRRGDHYSVESVGQFAGIDSKNCGVTEYTDKLSKLFSEIDKWRGKSAAPVRLVVPAPLGHASILKLQQLPGKKSSRDALVRMDIARHGAGSMELEIRSAPLGKSGDVQYLLGTALPSGMVGAIRVAANASGLLLDKLNIDLVPVFNFLQSRLVHEIQGGAMIFLGSEVWLLMISDSEGRMRFQRTKWRNQSAGVAGQEWEELAAETERSIRAYVHDNKSAVVSSINVVVESEVDLPFLERLEVRMSSQPTLITPPDLISLQTQVSNESANIPAIAAAADQ